jgi:hypothetical protein
MPQSEKLKGIPEDFAEAALAWERIFHYKL